MHFPRIRDLREDHELTQQAIADMLHMRLTVYRRYELGEREAPSWVIVRLAEYYRVSADYILGLTNDPRPAKRK